VAPLLALLRAGMVAVPLSTRVPESGVPQLLERAGCSALISTPDPAPEIPCGVRLLEAGELDRGSEIPGGEWSLDDPATVVFTSGSTGGPKAALHSLGNHYYSALGSNENIPPAPGDRWLAPLPFYHVGGLGVLFRCLLSGAAIALPRAGESIGEAADRLGATHASLVATQLRRLLSEETLPETLRAVLLGGGAIPETLLDVATEAGLPVHTSYGMTEMSSQVTTTPPGASRETLRTSGKMLPHRELRISDEGEILVRGQTLFQGYLDGDDLRDPADENGWFHTGDLGALDADGYLTVRGRLDNMFVSGGENVQPEEIEESLKRLDGIEDAAVVPVPDAEFGYRPAAFVRSPGEIDGKALSAELEPTLPRFMIPVAFHPWPEADSGMKPDRKLLARLAREKRESRDDTS
jgi:O-succinylbenzoic acid--CoA ligase